MTALGKGHAVFISEEIAGDIEIAAVIASGQANLGSGIGSRTAAHHERAERQSRHETRKASCGGTGSGFPSKEVSSTRVPEAGCVEQTRRKLVGLLDAGHLLAQSLGIGAVEVGAGGGEVLTVVDGVNGA